MSTFTEYLQAGTSTASMTGNVDGTNTVYTIAVVPNSVQIFRNGQQQVDSAFGAATFDYSTTIGTATVTFSFLNPPQTGDILAAWVFQN